MQDAGNAGKTSGTIENDGGFTFLPPGEFSPDERVRSAYYCSTNAALIEDTMLAVGGQFILRSQGETTLHFPDGTIASSKPGQCYFIAPTTMASKTIIRGSVHFVGLGFSELGWAELTGLPVDKVKNTTVPATDVFGTSVTEFAEANLQQYLAGEIRSQDIALKMRAFIEPRFSPLDKRRKRVIQTTRAWATNTLMPDISVLYDAIPYSERQIQRIVKQYFGQPPSQVARRLRATFVASVTSHRQTTSEVDAAIGETYFDQSHMIRDVKATTGRTPSNIGKDRKSLLSDILNPAGFLHDTGHVKKLPGRLKGSDQQE